MLKVIERVFSPTVFKVLMLIATIFTLIPLVHFAFGGYVKYLLAFGIVVCVLSLTSGNLINGLKNKASIGLLCFALSYAISIILNSGAYLSENIKQWVYMLVFFLLLFSISRKKEKKSVEKEMLIVSSSIVVLTFAFSMISFFTYRYNISEWYYVSDYVVHYLGMYTYDRFYGLFNPNTGGALSVISVLLSIYLISKNKVKNKVVKIIIDVFLVINIIFEYFMLLISLSRGSYYSFLISSALATFLFFIKNFRRDKFKLAVRLVIAIFASVILVFGIIEVSSLVQSQKDKLVVVSYEDSQNPDLDTAFENGIEEIIKKYFDRTSALAGLFRADFLSLNSSIGRDDASITDTTGRLPVWKAGFNVFLSSPMFGMTREGFVEPVCEALKIINGDSSGDEIVTGGGLHNVYLTVLCSSGIVGFLLLAFVVVVILKNCVKCLSFKEEISNELLISIAICIYFFVSELVEARIVYTVSFFNVMFWIYFGYLNYFSLKGNKFVEEES